MHTKVFVGNLSFKTKAEELASEFSVAGRVVSANIITRGPRSLGYGFVELETEEEAQKAVALLNKKSIDSREINVELAKPRDEAKIAEKRQSHLERGRGRRGSRGGGRGRGGYGGGDRGDRGGDHPGASSNNNNQLNSPGGDHPRGRGGRGRGGFRGGANQTRRYRRGGGGDRRAPRQQNFENRTPSPTTLFVANLPFSLDDQGLHNLFKNHKVAKAHVVKNRSGRSKGFGFVEFENEADQKAALTASEKLSVEGRDLAVKIALTAPEGAASSSSSSSSSSTSAPSSASSSITTPVASTSSPSTTTASSSGDSKDAK